MIINTSEVATRLSSSEMPDEEPDTHFTSGDFLAGLNPRDLLPPPLPRHFRLTLYVTYILIMTSAALANGVVMTVIIRVTNMRTVTNVFFLSLAASDLLIALVNMPLQLTYYVSNQWTMGQAVCKVGLYT